MTTLLLVVLVSAYSFQAATPAEVRRHAQLRTFGNLKYVLIEPGAPQDEDVRELFVKMLPQSYVGVAVITSLDGLNEEQQGQTARCILSEQRGNHLTLECRDAAARYIGTLVSGPAPLNRTVSTAMWGLIEQLQQLKLQSGPAARPLTAIKYLNVMAWPDGDADRTYFIAELRRATPFTIVDDIVPTGVDPAEVVTVTLHDPRSASGPMLMPSIYVEVLLTDSDGARVAQIRTSYGGGLTLSFHSYSHRRINAAVKALRQAYERDKQIYVQSAVK